MTIVPITTEPPTPTDGHEHDWYGFSDTLHCHDCEATRPYIDMIESGQVMSLPDAERLAEQTLAAIDRPGEGLMRTSQVDAYARERVTFDLAGLREHQSDAPVDRDGTPTETVRAYCLRCEGTVDTWPCADARRYSDNLRRTAVLYGVT